MPKQKTHKGARKRFTLTATGKVRRSQSLRNHILTTKTTKRKRQLRRKVAVEGRFARTLRQLLHH